MLSLKGKKVLYIGQSFFGYEKEIKLMLESEGASVDFYNERPSSTFLTKAYIRLKLQSLIYLKIQNYYNSILAAIKDVEYDYVFVVKIETIDVRILKQLKKSQVGAEFILYMWDSLKNYKQNDKILDLFDRAYTFDSYDVSQYLNLKFLPLFYIPKYERVDDVKVKYDLCFIGSGHSDRYEVVNKLFKIASELNLTKYTFFFLQSKIIFIFRKLFDKRLQEAKINEFSFDSLSQDEIIQKMLESKVVLDIEHPGQIGLTMRTIEMIGLKKKLITTNTSIKEYDFYNKNNIYVVDRKNLELDVEFFTLPYEELKVDIYNKYSLKNWVQTIFKQEH